MTTTLNPTVQPARYTESPLPAFAGNPLIEALPPIISDDEWVREFTVNPRVGEALRQLPVKLRKLALVGLEEFNYPVPEAIELASRVEAAIYRGYSTKNPLSPTSTHFLHYLDPDETPVQPSSGRFEPRPTGITLIGPSGTGKSRAIENILAHYPQVIEHEEYHGRALRLKQVVWLKFDCPEENSLVTFASRFLQALDEAVGEQYFDTAFREKNSKGTMATKMIRHARNYRIGLIVLQEFSNLTLPKRASVESSPTLLKLILNLMNASGVPFVFSGNPEMLDTVQFTLKTARRAENGGFIEMGPMHPAMWRSASRRLWKLQVTTTTTPWTEENAKSLYAAAHGLDSCSEISIS